MTMEDGIVSTNEVRQFLGMKPKDAISEEWLEQQFAEKGYAEVELTDEYGVTRTARLYKY